MRYELTDREWAAIRPMLPNKPRGDRWVDDRRVLNGIFWVLRSDVSLHKERSWFFRRFGDAAQPAGSAAFAAADVARKKSQRAFECILRRFGIGIDLLARAAWRIETVRRALIDLYLHVAAVLAAPFH
jgi:hypothetical protein